MFIACFTRYKFKGNASNKVVTIIYMSLVQ